MAKRRMGIMVLLLCFCLSWMPRHVQAASTAEALEPISLDKACSLTICYGCGGTAFSDLPVKLYKIADVSADFQYALTSPYAGSGLILNGIQTVGEWNVIRATLESYILANGITEDVTAVTSQAGQARFEGLKPGLYLASPQQVVHGDLHYFFDAALVALPGLGADGLWQYQVEVAAKSELVPPVEPDEQIELKVLKLWKGDEGRSDRPQGIQVEIFRDGTSYETVTLSEDNHWSYSWSAKDDGANWKVVERNVPAGYTMTVEERSTSFILTNTRVSETPDTPKPPQTGDTANILLYILLMNVSGIMLVILGLTGKRKRL